MEMVLFFLSEDIAPYFEQGVQACNNALQANPESADALGMLSNIYFRMGDYVIDQGKDPIEYLQKAIKYADQALNKRPRDENLHSNKGNIFWKKAFYEQKHGQNS
ncbi:MAG: hypothetical protein A2Y62_19520 [Candidatus Fischerbacteria bacterium RBG_13_37_8]|uniref:Uncharacterized protein n=1 Tax=Candidatus Fischerbacteria bacterium RBG_13_37_8 TaxID=1817863 RepID=A0A1F5VYL2_9BACT|nr:MAG: hypothetical protein A2Y62_19520 [Candidatus Fischerbacteria bacterium RBG_13_37_8]